MVLRRIISERAVCQPTKNFLVKTPGLFMSKVPPKRPRVRSQLKLRDFEMVMKVLANAAVHLTIWQFAPDTVGYKLYGINRKPGKHANFTIKFIPTILYVI